MVQLPFSLESRPIQSLSNSSTPSSPAQQKESLPQFDPVTVAKEAVTEDLEIGTLVELRKDGEPFFGVVRWIGWLNNESVKGVGVELVIIADRCSWCITEGTCRSAPVVLSAELSHSLIFRRRRFWEPAMDGTTAPSSLPVLRARQHSHCLHTSGWTSDSEMRKMTMI